MVQDAPFYPATALWETWQQSDGFGCVRAASALPLLPHSDGSGCVVEGITLLRFLSAAGSISIPFRFLDGVAIRGDPVRQNGQFTGGESVHGITPSYDTLSCFLYQALAHLSERLLSQPDAPGDVSNPPVAERSGQDSWLESSYFTPSRRVVTARSDDVSTTWQLHALAPMSERSQFDCHPPCNPSVTEWSGQDDGLEGTDFASPDFASPRRAVTARSGDVPSPFHLPPLPGMSVDSITS